MIGDLIGNLRSRASRTVGQREETARTELQIACDAAQHDRRMQTVAPMKPAHSKYTVRVIEADCY